MSAASLDNVDWSCNRRNSLYIPLDCTVSAGKISGRSDPTPSPPSCPAFPPPDSAAVTDRKLPSSGTPPTASSGDRDAIIRRLSFARQNGAGEEVVARLFEQLLEAYASAEPEPDAAPAATPLPKP